MTYQHLSQTERYQIYILMKDGKTQSQIAQLLNRYKSTVSREIGRNTGLKGYRPKQACLLAEARSLGSRNAARISPVDWAETIDYLEQKWSPEQIANHIGISHETIYRHVYANKAAGGSLYQQLRCQKKRKKRYASGHDRRGQIVGRRPISERPAHIEARSQIGHWEGDTVIGAHHKQAIVTLVERKSGYALIAKVSNKTSDLVSAAIINKLSPMAHSSKRLLLITGKNLLSTNVLITPSHQPLTLPIRLPAGNGDLTKTSMVYCVNISRKRGLYRLLLTRSLE